MRLSAIVAMSDNRVIGNHNQLPWHLPADLKHFKNITLGKPIIMGRKTFESIGRPLPGRTNIVITRDVNFKAPGCLVMNSIDAALAAMHENEEVVIIGGAQLYQQMMPRLQRIYLTIIHQEFIGDAFFPALDLAEWHEVSREDFEGDEQNKYKFSFLIFEKK